MDIHFSSTLNGALALEKQFPTTYRDQFHIPVMNEREVVYLCGNSLGLQPKSAKIFIDQELNQWKNLGVEGHFEGDKPWMHYHKFSKKGTAILLGAIDNEVVMMNSLTTNLHLLMVSFYKPTKGRFKIITEAGAFSSDQYALETQVKFHGFDPQYAIIELKPREGEYILRTEDILTTIQKHSDELALVMIGGVNYFTGQAFDIEAISKAAHQVGAYAGYDLAHAIGNVNLQLHDWDVDFAVWCSYKYLNAGPGGVGGAFVHQQHHDVDLPRFGGWWGHREEERFLMKKGFQPAIGADGWQLSNAPILPLAAYMASLEIFNEVGFSNLLARSRVLTGYLEYLIKESKHTSKIQIITPTHPNERGAQLSLIFNDHAKHVFKHLHQNNFIVDWREPNVIRVSPVPLYNSFLDVYHFMTCVNQLLG